jgi:hypothetical protein
MAQMGASNQFFGSYAMLRFWKQCAARSLDKQFGVTLGPLYFVFRFFFLRFLNSIMSRKSSRIDGPDGRFKPVFWVVCCLGF